ncbi:TatD family deoxyribonuclease [Nitrosomonas sp. JL21]|uniref:Qat anti-phage system TatD family nuclease QatD n=1 Tax=Nitrosomonas sp. JL21 TaxID=153949 RepID=UPI001369BEC2|nr:Qat anti-phage system TatD family nuclease QatD [Nitrosomonas sp. JL21]MXS77896.1 TatD family deoxyribonuclease [Nitrosomonas sp. JL21]
MALIDFHCHLDLFSDPHRVAQEATRRGIYVLSVTTTPSAFLGTKALAPPNSRIRTALGLHPEIAVARENELSLFEKLLPSTAYVGEVGLDGSRQHRDTLDRQGAILTTILSLCAAAGGKTISLHSRGAVKPLLDIIEYEPLAGRPILHWFLGTEKEISRAVEMGCWFSVGPAMLRSETGRKVAKKIPLDRVLPETDGPLAKINQKKLFPWDAIGVNSQLETILSISSAEIEDIFSMNFKRLISLSGRDEIL